MSDRSYIVVSESTTANNALSLCGCVPSCFLAETPTIVCATSCVKSPVIQLTTGAASGCVLLSDANGCGVWTTPSFGASALSGLTDTNISSPVTGNILTYSGGTWCNVAPVDVSSNLTTGRVVCYDGTTLATATCVTTQCYFEFTSVGIAHGIRSCSASANAGNSFYILGEEGGTNQPGGPIEIVGGCGGLTNGNGGQARIYGGCGRGTGAGGQVIICGGNASSGSVGGHISLIPGLYSTGYGCLILCGRGGATGNIYMCGLNTTTCACAVLIDSSGCLSLGAKTSDCRFKCNLCAITGMTSLLSSTNAYSAELYGTDTGLDGLCQYVLIAQELENTLPLAVRNDAYFHNETYLRIDYEQIIPVLWSIVKEQQAKINELETRIETLENN